MAVLNRRSAQVSINNKKVDLSYSFTESRAVRQCVDSSPCDRRPCLNGGHCLSSAEYEYQCLCQDGYEGAFKVLMSSWMFSNTFPRLHRGTL